MKMKMIPFYLDTIEIVPDEATHAKHLDRVISLYEFTKGEPCSLYELENGELLARKGRYPNIEFIQGREVTS